MMGNPDFALQPLRDGRWLLEGLSSPLVLSGDQLNALADLLAFRFRGILQRDGYGGLAVISETGGKVHVAFSDEADHLLDALRSQSTHIDGG
jgi:hypothetical protein